MKALLAAICLHWTVPDTPCTDIIGYRIWEVTPAGHQFVISITDTTAWCEPEPGTCYAIDTVETGFQFCNDESCRNGPLCVDP